jgi:spore maturation protein CgeB
MRYDYGRMEQGTSFEYNNFYRTLIRFVPEVVEFDFMTVLQQHGKAAMNKQLLEIVAREEPDLVFFVLFTDEIERTTIERLTRRCVTFNWFCDDHWRFNAYSKYYAPHFAFVSTTDRESLPKYENIGYTNVFLTQWACNHYDYVRLQKAVRTIDISFVGQPHGSRRRVIGSMRRAGLNVQAYGRGWPNGRVSQHQMIRLFNASKVNLNLANSSWNARTFFRRPEQIKGRNFEIPGCGGFILTTYIPDLEQYYEIGSEVECFRNQRELIEKARYYQRNDDAREEIARRGYERTIREHTYEKRCRQLFDQMGFDI